MLHHHHHHHHQCNSDHATKACNFIFGGVRPYFRHNTGWHQEQIEPQVVHVMNNTLMTPMQADYTCARSEANKLQEKANQVAALMSANDKLLCDQFLASVK